MGAAEDDGESDSFADLLPIHRALTFLRADRRTFAARVTATEMKSFYLPAFANLACPPAPVPTINAFVVVARNVRENVFHRHRNQTTSRERERGGGRMGWFFDNDGRGDNANNK